MSQKTTLKAKGLYTDPNQLSGIPEGSLVTAENVVIDRIDVIEPRKGMAEYANTFGLPDARAKQLLTYKDRILVHYDTTLLFNANPHNNTVDGNLQPFNGVFAELDPGRRIRAVESNKNLFFTTADGIKKISAKTAADFSTTSGFIIDAGAAKALDVTGELNSTTEGFLPPNSEVAYRVVWSYKDRNGNLIAGTPSSRLVMSNSSTANANVDLEFVIPQNVTTDYFYQVYRSAVFTATGNLTLDDIDPGDELQLVLEDFPSAAQMTAGLVQVTDLAPEDFRAGGLPLYTNPNSGEGIGQANEPPPKAKDLTMYQSTVFYANTETRARTTIALLGVEDLVSGVSSVTIDNGSTPAQTYTFVGEKEITDIDFTAYAGSIPVALDGKYFLMNSSSDNRKYYVWYDNTKTTQLMDFANYIGTIPTDLGSKYFVLYTKDSDRTYYVWFDATGSDIDPGTDAANELTGFAGIKIDISTGVTNKAQLCTAIAAGITLNDIDSDFDVTANATNVTVLTESFDTSAISFNENILKGFNFTITTPPNSDPAQDLITNTDVVGKIGFRVNVSRGITTNAQVADATAAAILDLDTALDFEVTYTGGSTVVTVETTNNGKTTDAADSSINPIGNGFAINVTQQGDGEDPALNHVLLSAAASPAQQIDETARSLVNVINRNSAETVYAFYLSGANDLPGQILLEVKDIGVNQFSVTADNASTGESFNPSLPPFPGASPVVGEAETKPNRIYFAKLQQPEAVPLLNFLDVGPEDKAISRILALRESLFVLKEDGIYRLTGIDGNYAVDLFDESTKIIAPDTAVVLNNQIYCLTNQGVVAISDTGVSIISAQIDGTIQLYSSSNYNFEFTSFGISYETDRAYLMFMPTSPQDSVATVAFRYNTQTNTFTTFDMSKTCGLVNPGDDKLYLGPADKNFIERERKNFNRTDYADRDFELIIPSDSVNGTTLRLSTSTDIDIGDALVQSQYLTVGEYNQLLNKLDLDPSIGDAEVTRFDFTAYSAPLTALHSKYFLTYSASDTTRYVVFYDAFGTLPSLDPTVFPDIADAKQVRVPILGLTTLAEVTEATKIAIQSSTFDFLYTYTVGDTFFTTKTVRNGNTSDSSDSAVNGLNNGFAVTTLVQGLGDYFNSLQMFAGDNVISKLNELATRLDTDPGVAQTDFVNAISPHSGVGATTAAGNPTVINFTNHNVYSGRLVTISNSTQAPNGVYVATRINANQFSIPVTTANAGTCDFDVNVTNFAEAQGAFNAIVIMLNNDDTVTYQNYLQSTGIKEYEVLILGKARNTTDVIMQFAIPLMEGPITVFKGINVTLQYAPETFGDVSMLKQITESTVIFEDGNFSRGTVGYRSDLSPGFEVIDFTKSGKGDFSFFIWSQHNWGGGFSGVPLRTYIPRQKQRCRYIQMQFLHNSSREKFSLYGYSYTFRPISERAYRS